MECPRLSLPPLSAPGEVVTFYSYKGGTGRTMALSNIAVLLARRDNASVPVLMLDWDMEAPGLHHYFDQHQECPGVLEFFEACREQLELLGATGFAADGEHDYAALAERVLDAIDWQQYVVRVDQGSPLYLMRAGRFDASYSERLAQMRWDQLFDACPALFRCFADTLARHFRYVLVDSRTGRTDSAGICTTLLPRKLVVVFTPNRQSLEGVDALVTRAIEYRRSHEDEQRPLLVYPLPSRIEMGDGAQRAEWRRGDSYKGIAGYQPMFERLLRTSYGLPQIALDSYFDEVQLQQTKTFAYGEQLAVRIDQGGDRFSLTRTFEAFLQWLTGGYFPWQSSREIGLLAAIDEARRALQVEPGRAVALPLARDLARLGELYRKDGRPEPALDAFRQSVEIRTRILGGEHIDTLTGKSGMARLLRQLGTLDEARQLEEDVARARERLQGAEHADTLAARACLAQTMVRQGDYAAALALQDAVLASQLRLLGSEHPRTLGAMACRATTLLHMGSLDEARQLLDTVVAARTRLFGAEHGDTLHSKLALAQVLGRQGDLEGARQLLDAILQAQERSLGLDHPVTLATRDRLADIVAGLGDWAGARQLHENQVAARERTRGLDHPETLMSQRKLAEALLRRGELEAARNVQQQVLEVHARLLGEHHLDTLHSRMQLAGTMQQQASLADHGAPDTEEPETLTSMIAMLQGMIEREQYRQAGELAEHLKSCLLRPGVAGNLRKRGMAQLKRLYKQQGDLDALFALQEDEVQALEGALSEARIEQR
ncbi:tetratricopeptide repeat protein [Janthinobacterium psychrotolerans]|uniref:Tetratricopeptide repeat-containing protein n=1 Tax=Janthinobacterium psychrotolerans TaxID=1747903 RepID=A0A1A7BXB9_9BURK|nr:tetratricopeptide repeat protein [Janthinobacterium psychrotolerans]OBV36773.1 Tetratricopeptide repeat-containing protein [Janthinobacterium psychrotolerans]